MESPLHILLVEDNADDAELVLRRLSRAGMEVSSQRVDSAASLIEALDSAEWDVILADYRLPGFGGLEAIELVTSRDNDVPLILVSGAIDVPTALAAMKAGARDFVPKSEIQRLPSVIEREVQEAAERRQRRLAEAERDQALAELREANEQLSAYAALADVNVRGTAFSRVVADLLRRVVTGAHADGATVLFPEGDRLVTGGAAGSTAGLELAVELGRGFAGVAAQEDRPIFIADVPNDRPDLDVAFHGGGVRSSIALPMHYAGKVSGVLRIEWSEPFEPPEWQVPLLQLAADRCSTMIENARLFEREHAIAETLQQVLLSAAPHIRGLAVGQFYASATVETLVGGDFYDVFEVAAGTVALSIGDVSGKGLDAARVTALAKNAMRTIASEGAAPSEVLGRSNNVVARFTESEMFVTSVFGLLDVATGKLTYSVAGHPPPAVIGPAGVRMLTSHGPLIGAFPDAAFPSAETILAPGESVILYTDGLTEAKSPDGDFFGEERLRASFEDLAEKATAPQDAASELFERVWEFCGGKLRDDIGILVLRPLLHS